MKSRSLKDLVHFDEAEVRRGALFETDNVWSEVLCFSPRQSIGPLRDDEADAIFTVVAGEGRFGVGRRSKTLGQWGSILVEAAESVSIFNTGSEPLVVLLMASPPPAGEEEVELVP